MDTVTPFELYRESWFWNKGYFLPVASSMLYVPSPATVTEVALLLDQSLDPPI